MAMPTRQEVIQKAKELYFEDCFKHGCQNPNSPEDSELLENGYYSQAVSELLRDTNTAEIAGFENFVKNVEQSEKPKENFEKKQTVSEIPFDVKEAMASGFYCCGTRQLSGKTNLVKQLVKRLIDNGITVFVIDPSMAWMNNSPIKQIVRIPRGRGELTVKHQSTVFDVSRLGYGERFIFVKNFCAGFTLSHINGYPFAEMIIFEEAQTYLPNGCMRSKKYSDITDFVTVGGNYGLSFGVITQFSASVDKAVVKLAQQRYFGLTTEDNDKKYVRSFIGKKYMDDLISLQLGQFLYQNRATIQKFQCKKYGAISNSKNNFSYEYQFQMGMVV